MRRTTLYYLLATATLASASFVPPTRPRLHIKRTSIVRACELPPTPPEVAEEDAEKKEAEGYPGQEVVRKVFDGAFKIQSLAFEALGAALFVGLILNLMGIGYTSGRCSVAPESAVCVHLPGQDVGLVIRPLSDMRRDVADRRFIDAARRTANPDAEPPVQPKSPWQKLRGGAAAKKKQPAAPTTGSNSTAIAWVRSHLEECLHIAICAWAVRDVPHSVAVDQWVSVRLDEKEVEQRGDAAILKRRRRAAKVAQAFGAGYTPRITFLAGMMLRSLQMATRVRDVFDPSFGYAAGATMAAKYSQREWLPCILLGWGVGGLYWSLFRVRPPGATKEAYGLRIL